MSDFTDHEFMTAAEKRKVRKQWTTFLCHGLRAEHFTRPLYHHLVNHAHFIAHFGRGGFYQTYFEQPEDTLRFLSQFDPDGPGISVEYGSTDWLNNEVAGDLNRAMQEALWTFLTGLREALQHRRLRQAEDDLTRAHQRVQALRAGQ